MQAPPNGIKTTTISMARKLNSPQREALRDALSMFRIGFVRDHLMGTSPATDAAILSSPLQQMHTFTFETGGTFNESNNDEGTPNIVSSESMMVPAYNKQGMNFGYMVAESYGLTSKEFPTVSNGVSTARVVARERDGTYYGLVRQPPFDTLVRISMGYRRSIAYSFQYPIGSLARLINCSLDNLSAFEHALCGMNYADNFLACIICGAPKYAPCSCWLGMTTAKSSLDMQAITQNLLRLKMGQTDGNGICKLFENDGTTRTLPINFKAQIVQKARDGVATRLFNLALEDMFQSMHIGVPRSIEPSTSSDTPLANQGTERNLTADAENSVDFPSDLSPPILSGTPTLPHATSANHATNGNLSEIVESSLDFPSDLSPLNFSSTNPSMRTNTEGIDDLLWPWNTASSTEAAIESIESLSANHSQGNDGRFISTTKLLQPTQPNTCTITNSQIATTVSRAKPIAPRSLPKEASAEQKGTELDDERMRKAEQEVRAWRAYKRKIRNRESAARSNRARKKRLELEREKKQTQTSPG